MSKRKQCQPEFVVSVEREAKIRNIIDGSEMPLDRHLFACQFDDGAVADLAREFYSYIKKELVLGCPRLNRAAMLCDYDYQLLGLLSVAIGGDAVRRAIMALDSKIVLMATRDMVFLEAGNGQALKIASFLLNTNIKGQRLQDLGVRRLRGNIVRKMVKELKGRINQFKEGSSVANENIDGIDDINFFLVSMPKGDFL